MSRAHLFMCVSHAHLLAQHAAHLTHHTLSRVAQPREFFIPPFLSMTRSSVYGSAQRARLGAFAGRRPLSAQRRPLLRLSGLGGFPKPACEASSELEAARAVVVGVLLLLLLCFCC